jgi:2-iminobutanoate/2-iminopropanoate deaminase
MRLVLAALFAIFFPGALVLSAPPEKEAVATKDAPSAAGAYSQAIKAGGFVFVSGYLARDPATNKMIEGDVKVQTERVLKNISAVLVASGSSLDKVVKTTVYLRYATDFAAMNEVYSRFFTVVPPARTTIQAAPPNDAALVEIDVVALQ